MLKQSAMEFRKLGGKLRQLTLPQDVSSFAEDWGDVLAPLMEMLQSPLSDLLALVRA